MKRGFSFFPLDTRIFDPEACVLALAPVGHFFGIEKLEPEVEAAHRAIFLKMAEQLILQGV